MYTVAIILIIFGTFFLFTGTVGLLRFPNFYTRMHATGKCDTLGSLLILAGLALYNGVSIGSAKIIIIAIFIFITSPTATHSIARAALKNRIPLWKRKEKK